MRAFIIFGAFTILAECKHHKREANPRSLRKSSKDELASTIAAAAAKRRLATDGLQDEQKLEGFRLGSRLLEGTHLLEGGRLLDGGHLLDGGRLLDGGHLLEGGLLAQVAGAITSTGHDLLDTAAKGQKLLRADAKLAIGNAVEPIYLGVQDDAQKIASGTRAIAESLGLDTMKSDAKKVITTAADVVRQGEQNIANALRDFTSSIISRPQ